MERDWNGKGGRRNPLSHSLERGRRRGTFFPFVSSLQSSSFPFSLRALFCSFRVRAIKSRNEALLLTLGLKQERGKARRGWNEEKARSFLFREGGENEEDGRRRKVYFPHFFRLFFDDKAIGSKKPNLVFFSITLSPFPLFDPSSGAKESSRAISEVDRIHFLLFIFLSVFCFFARSLLIERVQ